MQVGGVGGRGQGQGERGQGGRGAAAADPVQQQVAGVQVPADRILRLGLGIVGQRERHHQPAVAGQRSWRPHLQQRVERHLRGQRRQPRPPRGRLAGVGVDRRRDQALQVGAQVAARRDRRPSPAPAPPSTNGFIVTASAAPGGVTPETSAVCTGMSSEGPSRTCARPGWLRGILAAAGESITSEESCGVCTRRQTRRLVLARMFSLTAPEGRWVASSRCTPRLRPRWAMPDQRGDEIGQLGGQGGELVDDHQQPGQRRW